MLRISASVSFGLMHLPQAIAAFGQRYPDVRVQLSLNDRNVDLVAEQIDIAMRLGPLSDSSLMARKLTEIERVICASPSYIERFGAPRTYDDLAKHQCVVFAIPSRDRWPFRTREGGLTQVQVSGPCAADNALIARQLALLGVGITRIPDFTAADAIRTGALVPLLTSQHDAQRAPVFLVYQPGTQRIPKIRAFLDFLVEWFEQPDVPLQGVPLNSAPHLT